MVAVCLNRISMKEIAPGPWTYKGGGIIEDATGNSTIYLAGRLNDGNADVIGHRVAAVNEVIAALEALVDLCPPYREEWLTDAAYAEAQEADRNARAALRKARGEGAPS
jgi:hypothetical protein